MNCTILLHSTTGNTRVVTRFAAARIEAKGHRCTIHDVARHPEPPSLDDVDLLGVSCPTMYFRPTLAMERAVDRLPAAAGGALRPAFLLATASGETGAHFPLLAEQLRGKGWWTLGARFVPCVNNWPPQRTLTGLVAPARPLAEILVARWEQLGARLSFLWPDVGETEARFRGDVAAFVDEMLRRAGSDASPETFAPTGLRVGSKLTSLLGRRITPDKMRWATSISICAERCTACGVCVAVCPVGCLSREEDDDVPRVGDDCTGCWACHNHCPEGAISGLVSPHGAGRYAGPSRKLRDLFR